MNYLSIGFFAFFIIFFGVYYLTPSKYRYLVIFMGSYFFYGYANLKMLLVLIFITTDYFFEDELMSNAIYHCSPEGERKRTELLIRDLRRANVIR